MTPAKDPTDARDPTDAIRRHAASFPEVATGTACTQSAFKAGKGTFLFIGPGTKGQGFKAMFKLGPSMAQARDLAAREPTRFEVGSTTRAKPADRRGGRVARGEPVAGTTSRDSHDPRSGEVGWVTARFTAAEPLPKRIWETWLAESYDLTLGGGRKPAKSGRAGRRRSPPS